jgi:transmembrane serine protease 3
LTIFNNTFCNDIYKSFRRDRTYEIVKEQICAGASYLTGDHLPGDTMAGDSGGPLAIKIGEKWTLAGVTSCSYSIPPAPGIYVRVSEYIPWIHKQIKKTEFQNVILF